MAEDRRIGGLRRRREKTISVAYDFDGLDEMPKLRRLLDIASLDALALENSIARCRVLIAAVLAGARLLEVGEQEERVAALEAALGQRIVAKTR